VVVALALLLPSASFAEVYAGELMRPADPCAIPDPQRPYVCDIGPPRPLSMRSFLEIAQRDHTILDLIARVGMPDRAELQEVTAGPPWLGWEIRTYYRRYDYMYVFGRSFILGDPEVSLIRYEGPMPDRLWVRPLTAEEAALRAEQAAALAEAEAERAEQYADRAEADANRLKQDFHQSLRKN
jgi:hypothetical protein